MLSGTFLSDSAGSTGGAPGEPVPVVSVSFMVPELRTWAGSKQWRQALHTCDIVQQCQAGQRCCSKVTYLTC